MTPGSLTPKHLTKQEFGRRVYRLMIEHGWNQSELARQSGLPRDSISVYINGRSLPSPDSLQKLADALEVDPTELLPNYTERALDDDIPDLAFTVSPGDPSKAWLRVNRLVKVGTAAKIVELLTNDDVLANRK